MTDDPAHVFVYGTLQPGEERWPVLEPLVIDQGRPAMVRGRLYDTGAGYPAALFPADVEALIVGRVYALRDESMQAALELLDDVEAAVEGLYRRVVVETTDGLRAWAYEFGAGLQLAPIASGDWLRRG